MGFLKDLRGGSGGDPDDYVLPNEYTTSWGVPESTNSTVTNVVLVGIKIALAVVGIVGLGNSSLVTDLIDESGNNIVFDGDNWRWDNIWGIPDDFTFSDYNFSVPDDFTIFDPTSWFDLFDAVKPYLIIGAVIIGALILLWILIKIIIAVFAAKKMKRKFR